MIAVDMKQPCPPDPFPSMTVCQYCLKNPRTYRCGEWTPWPSEYFPRACFSCAAYLRAAPAEVQERLTLLAIYQAFKRREWAVQL